MAYFKHLSEYDKERHDKVIRAIFDELEKKDCRFLGIPSYNRKTFEVTAIGGCSSIGPGYYTHNLTTSEGQSSLLRACSARILEHAVCAKHNRKKVLRLEEIQPWLNVADLLREIC